MTFQQRPFFQAVGKTCSGSGYDVAAKTVRFHFRLWITVILALLFVSCASLTNDRIATLVAIATQAAQLGAQDWLAAHPEHAAAFQAVIDAINIELRAGNTTRAIAMLHSLPVTSLSGKDGEVYWTGEPRKTNAENAVVKTATTGTLVIWDGELAKAVRVTGEAERLIVVAIRNGLKRAVAPMPPAVPARPKRGEPVLGIAPEGTLTGRDDLRFQHDLPAKSDVELDAEFRAIKAAIEKRKGK